MTAVFTALATCSVAFLMVPQSDIRTNMISSSDVWNLLQREMGPSSTPRSFFVGILTGLVSVSLVVSTMNARTLMIDSFV